MSPSLTLNVHYNAACIFCRVPVNGSLSGMSWRTQQSCRERRYVLSNGDGKMDMFTGRVAFEKLTELDYRGSTYYTVKNLSLYECQGWCREEPDCQAAAFR